MEKPDIGDTRDRTGHVKRPQTAEGDETIVAKFVTPQGLLSNLASPESRIEVSV